MKLSDLEDFDKIDNAFARLDNKIGALENKIEARFNALDAKINGQRVLMVAAIIGVLAQIVNAWIVALSHLAK
jgi:hypothetical protein